MTTATTPTIIVDVEDEEGRLLDSIIDELQMKDYSEWGSDEFKTIPENEFAATLKALNVPKRVGDTNTIRFTDNEVAESDRDEVDDEEEDEEDEVDGRLNSCTK